MPFRPTLTGLSLGRGAPVLGHGADTEPEPAPE